jgi:hypothetical protein
MSVFELVLIYIKRRHWGAAGSFICPNATVLTIHDRDIIKEAMEKHEVNEYGEVFEPDIDWFNDRIDGLKAMSIESARFFAKRTIDKKYINNLKE